MDYLSSRRRRRSSYSLVSVPLAKRIGAALLVGVALLGVVYVGRIAVGVANLSGENPIAALLSLAGGGRGSVLAAQIHDLHRINIALYGYGGDGHDGAYLTDSIMVVSIQPQASGPAQVAEISIPRDWFVPIDLGGGQSYYGRINEAYQDGQVPSAHMSSVYTGNHGGGNLADNELQKLLGIHIDHFVGVNFNAFKYAIDAVGGIDVNVQRSFTDSQYPHGECASGDCGFMTAHFDAGVQHMDGATALIFARSRHGDNGEASDFMRSKRQQLMIAALKQKVVSLGGLGSLPDVVNALAGQVLTDVDPGEARALYELVKDVPSSAIEHISIDNNNFLYTCNYPYSCDGYFLFANDNSYATLGHYMQNIFLPQDVVSDHAKVVLQDNSGRGDVVGQWLGPLSNLGLKCTDGGTDTTAATSQVIDGTKGGNSPTAKWLAHYFGAKLVVSSTYSPGAVTVVFGKDLGAQFNKSITYRD